MPQKSINELHKFHLQLMSVAMDRHFHRFFGDFDALLAEQVQKFTIQEFERFITTFQEYKLRDDTYQTADDVVQFFTLLTDTFKYDALFLSKEQFPNNHPIWTIPDLPIIGMTEFIDAIKHIENTKMVKINETSLIYHCLIHLRLKFLTAISVDFHNQFIKTTQGNSKRDKVSPSTMKPTTKTMRDRSIRDTVASQTQGAFGNGPEVWNALVKSLSPKKHSLRVPNFAKIVGTTPIRLLDQAKKGVVYESMIPLVKLLSPDFPIMDFKTWSEKNDDDKHSEYKSFYLSHRIKEFDPEGTLIR
jgi:hypothetical protein